MPSYRVDSKTTAGKSYNVTIGEHNSCDCKDYVNRKRDCKHIKLKMKELGLVKEIIDPYIHLSGIQKAVRRGDLALLKYSFLKLWDNDRRRLLWRLPIIVAEENWIYFGFAMEYLEIAESLIRKKESEKMAKKLIWQILALITVEPKNKDAHGIFNMIQLLRSDGEALIKDFLDEDAYKMLLDWEIYDILFRAEIHKKGDGEAEWEELDTFSKSDVYMHKILKYAKRRFKTMRNANLGDRLLIPAVIFLYKALEITEEKVPLNMGRLPAIEQVKALEDVPYYVVDKHTKQGKHALNILKKRAQKDFRVSPDLLQWLIFYFISAQVNKHGAYSYFWKAYKKLYLKKFGLLKDFGKRIQKIEQEWRETIDYTRSKG